MTDTTEIEEPAKPLAKLYDPHSEPVRSFDDRLFDAPAPVDETDASSS